ncbi:MAG: hypothetical protein MUC90_07480 [Thermoplasmata archaeon]|nr:hypothetical protein [Thermoplasmata archaeon]
MADSGSYTREELLVLASLRKRSKRTCRYCTHFVQKGSQRGCFPEGIYRKWLSAEEYDAGCDRFTGKGKDAQAR